MEVSQKRGSTVCRTDKHCARVLKEANARGGTSTIIYLLAHSLSPSQARAITYCSLSLLKTLYYLQFKRAIQSG